MQHVQRQPKRSTDDAYCHDCYVLGTWSIVKAQPPNKSDLRLSKCCRIGKRAQTACAIAAPRRQCWFVPCVDDVQKQLNMISATLLLFKSLNDQVCKADLVLQAMYMRSNEVNLC